VTPLVPSLHALDSLSGIDSLCLWVRTDERPLRGLTSFVDWRLCAHLSRLLLDAYFLGEEEEALLLAFGEGLPFRRVFIWGLGGKREWTPEGVEQKLEQTQKKLRLAGVSSLAMATPETAPEEPWQKACERHFFWVSTFVLFRPMSALRGAVAEAAATGKR
jgi:hypothetical protein